MCVYAVSEIFKESLSTKIFKFFCIDCLVLTFSLIRKSTVWCGPPGPLALINASRTFYSYLGLVEIEIASISSHVLYNWTSDRSSLLWLIRITWSPFITLSEMNRSILNLLGSINFDEAKSGPIAYPWHLTWIYQTDFHLVRVWWIRRWWNRYWFSQFTFLPRLGLSSINDIQIGVILDFFCNLRSDFCTFCGRYLG